MTPPKRHAGRPRGTFGDVSRALMRAAESGPGTVRELAARAQVGFDAARFKCPKLVAAGALVAMNEGRPRVLALPRATSASKADEPFFMLATLWRA